MQRVGSRTVGVRLTRGARGEPKKRVSEAPTRLEVGGVRRMRTQQTQSTWAGTRTGK